MSPTPAATRPHVRIKGASIVLAPLGAEHATEQYASWLNDPTVNRYLETRSVTIPELRAYINAKNASDDALLLGIFWKADSAHIGNLKLEPIDRAKGAAVMGILIGDKAYWGRGVATEATNLIVGYAFEQLGLKELTLGVIAGNKAAIRVYEKCGFTVTEVRKNAINHDGVLHDQICMRKCRTSDGSTPLTIK